MKIGVIACRVMEREIRAVVRDRPEVHHLEIMDWGLHVRPENLLDHVTRAIRRLEGQVDAVVLGYGRCQALDQLPQDLAVPVFRPQAEDCIGVMLGQDRYDALLREEPGTWFLTPGWTEMGMDFVFQELQLDQMIEKWAQNDRVARHDPMALAHRMLADYTRALLIDTGAGDAEALRLKAQNIALEFGWRLDEVPGSLDALTDALARARRHLLSRP